MKAHVIAIDEALCAGDLAKKRLPWTRALVDEGLMLSRAHENELSNEDRWVVESLLFGFDHLQYGDNEARRQKAERMRMEREGKK